jgi:hypothetical protein
MPVLWHHDKVPAAKRIIGPNRQRLVAMRLSIPTGSGGSAPASLSLFAATAALDRLFSAVIAMPQGHGHKPVKLNEFGIKIAGWVLTR